MRVLLIGGAGFIGCNIMKAMLHNGYKVAIADKKETWLYEKKDEYGIEYFCVNFVTGEGIDEAIREGDCVIHLVSTSLPNMSNNDMVKDAQENIIPSIRLLDCCREKNVAKFIYASSGGQVYGKPLYVPIDEKHSTNPASAYGIHKLAVEKYMLLMSNLCNLNVAILRISNPYGPGQMPFRGQGVIPTFIASALLGKKIQVWGDGSSIRDYIYIDDLAQAFVQTLKYKGTEKIFNIGSGQGLTVKEILEKIEEKIDRQVEIEYIDEGSSDVDVNILSCQKAKQELEWSAEVDLEEGLVKMIKCWDETKQSFIA